MVSYTIMRCVHGIIVTRLCFGHLQLTLGRTSCLFTVTQISGLVLILSCGRIGTGLINGLVGK